MTTTSTTTTPPLLDEEAEKGPESTPRKISLARSPEKVREMAHQLLMERRRCLPEHLRQLGVEGGNVELNDLIGEVRDAIAHGRGSTRNPAVDEAASPALPAEFRQIPDIMRSASAAFSTRVRTEYQEQAELRVAAVEQASEAREAALERELDEMREQAAACAEVLDQAQQEYQRAVVTHAQLEARIQEQAGHHAALQQSADDLRAAAQSAQETVRASAAEQAVLSTRVVQAEQARAELESTVESLRETVRTQADELRMQASALVARTQEAVSLQRMFDQLVETNAVLVGRLTPPIVPPVSKSRRRAGTMPKGGVPTSR